MMKPAKTVYKSDLFGRALLDFHKQKACCDLITWTDISPPEILRIAYFFRTYAEMPQHEQAALSLARGRILDIGAGAGAHSIWLQNRGADVTALEHSPALSELLRLRGIRNVKAADFFSLDKDGPYDTLLLLMNGAGMIGRLERAEAFFRQLHKLTHKNARILVHLSDIAYLYEAYGHPFPDDRYYGETKFFLKYGPYCTEPFPWIYFDPDLFGYLAGRYGFRAETILEEDTGDFLVRLTK